MAKKQKKAVKKRKFAAVKKVVTTEKEFQKGFFARFKDILPQQKKETVRVKTFIVEKPVIIQEQPQRIFAPRQKYNMDEDYASPSIDSKKSRYSKRRSEKEESEVETQLEENVEEDSVDDSSDLAQDDLGEEVLDENGDAQDLTGEEAGMEADAMPGEQTHVRSRAMFNNIWWKKALFWAILFWLLILAVSMAMQALKLLQVDLTRQWWILLAGIIVVFMVYFKFFEGKI